MKLVLLIIQALYRGVQLSKVETWKKVSVATAVVSALLSALVGIAVLLGWMDNIPPEKIMEVSSAIVTIVFAVLGYFGVATTEKIGIKPKSDNKPNSVQSMSSDPKIKESTGDNRSDVDKALHQWSGMD